MTESHSNGAAPSTGPTPDEEALRFLESLRSSGATTEAQRSFASWIRHSPENVAALLRQRMLGTELRALDPERKIDAEAFVSRTRAKVRRSKIIPWPRTAAQATPQGIPDASSSEQPWPEQRRRANGGWRAGLAMAAGVAVLFFAWHTWMRDTGGPTYRTAMGEHRVIQLADGSNVTLNTQSILRVEFTSGSRDVYLLGGEALFSVRHDPAVPFRVHVGASVIQDVGTQFSVLRTAGLTTVSVIEGVVDVSPDSAASAAEQAAAHTPPPLDVVIDTQEYKPLQRSSRIGAGEQLRIAADGKLMRRQKIDIAQATAWLHGRLVFDNATLEEIVFQFNRYNRRQIVLIGDADRGRRFSGVFDAADPDSFLEYLRRDDRRLAIEKDAAGLVIRSQD